MGGGLVYMYIYICCIETVAFFCWVCFEGEKRVSRSRPGGMLAWLSGHLLELKVQGAATRRNSWARNVRGTLQRRPAGPATTPGLSEPQGPSALHGFTTLLGGSVSGEVQKRGSGTSTFRTRGASRNPSCAGPGRERRERGGVGVKH